MTSTARCGAERLGRISSRRASNTRSNSPLICVLIEFVTTAMPAPVTRAINPDEDAMRLAASLDLRSEAEVVVGAEIEHLTAADPNDRALT